MNRKRMLVGGGLAAPAAAIVQALLPAAAYADTYQPTVIGPAEISVGQFVAILVCAAVVVAVGVCALVRIRRRRRREAGSETTTHGEGRQD